MTAEYDALHQFLDRQRRQVRSILDGLADEDLRRPILPSGWNCLGMLQHLSVNERYWLQWSAAGQDISVLYDDMPDPDNDWLVATDLTFDQAVQRYTDAIAGADKALVTVSLDDPARRVDPNWQKWFGDDADIDVRWIVLHMIEETARHAGHLDAVRELIDGHTWT